MPLQATSGAASYDAFGGGVAAVPNYIEDIFSTTLYTDSGSTQTINNGIDLAGKGGLLWVKSRSAVINNLLWDSARGTSNYLVSNNIGTPQSGAATTFNSNGFSVPNISTGATFASWTFRKQPKFFDVVTYTGNGVNGRTIAHNLGAVPGCIIVKRTDTANDWWVYHRSLTNERAIYLNLTNAAAFDAAWNNTDPTSTVFSVGGSSTNASGGTFVAYLFAHNAGGFGLSGTDNVISCGSFTTDAGGNATVDLGYEPQWLLVKATNVAQDWFLYDNMRGFSATQSANRFLSPNLSSAEGTGGIINNVLSTGFNVVTNENRPYIYIAIRRPMKVPTTGTSVFQPTAFTSQSGTDTVSSGSVPVVDWGFVKLRTSSQIWIAGDRLRGGSYLSFDTTSAELSNIFQWDKQNAFVTNVSDTPSSFIGYSFRRAPGFFDEVCYTGTGANRTVAHNLGVAPELMIVKTRNAADYPWMCYHIGLNNGVTPQNWWITLNTTNPNFNTGSPWNGTAPTSSVFSLGVSSNTNRNDGTLIGQYVAYLFASCPGVSKVGSYTGTGTTQLINCGFTGGARFVLIKATSTTGDWLVWDSSRGIVAGNDPYLALNSTAAEVTTTDWVDTAATGFELSNASGNLANTNGTSYIFLSVA